MSDAKDPAIKLFGRTIPVPEVVAAASAPVPSPSSSSGSGSAEEGLGENRPSSSSSPPEDEESNRVETEGEFDKVSSRGNGIDGQQGDGALPLASEELTDADTSSVVNENPKEKAPSSKPEEEQSETSNSQEKPLKKPDKILPCPRCTSMETKFCYYNNYNVNQPRHFCKNCQRYWTAGGTMRNVPVGAGRRKNKNLASHYRHITVSEALQNGQNDIRNAINGPLLKTNGTVLAFGSDTPLCESMTTALNLADKTAGGCTQGGVPRPEELRVPENDRASGSVVTDSNSRDHAGKTSLQEPVMQNYNGFNPQMPALPGAPWPYPWNAAQWSSPVPPPFYPAGFTMPFYPAATYWSCSVSGTWNVPWVSQPSSPSHLAPNSGPNSPTLGKHSRDENSLKPNDTGEEEPIKEKSFWVPKTLRIDDPGEAAKSSIWATLGIKNDKVESPNGRGVFKAFQSKNGEKNHVTEAPPTLQANPAALSRSQNFQERS